MEDFNSQDSQEIMKNFKSIVGSRLDKLYDEKGSDGELYAYSIAVTNQKKKKAKETPQDTTMENSRLREMVIDALTEKKKSSAFTPEYDDKFTDKRKDLPDGLQKSILKKQGKLEEDLDLGHTDDEPHMLKADLYRIGKYAMELYKMVDQFEGPQEVDFPHWWQSKIIQAKSMLVSAKHYLDFETKEPQIDAIVTAASEEGALEEKITKATPAGEVVDDFYKSKAPQFKGKSKEKKRKMAIAAYLSKHPEKVKEAVIKHLKDKK